MLVPARPAVVPDTLKNDIVTHKVSSRRQEDVLLLGDASFETLVASSETVRTDVARKVEETETFIKKTEKMDGEKVEVKHAVAVAGHVLYAPPIAFGVGDLEFAQDFAIVQVDHSKLSPSNFLGNAIDLGAGIDPQTFNRLAHSLVSTNDLYRPPTLNQRDNPYCIVVKRGCTTGLTISYANNICSYARYYFKDREPQETKEWLS
ncbi:hypothetical protein PQX77_000721 [Marasmius sp. AFHP31]|nr:hypothetical protein PQX77_000721 [Marasmius sp. AFHP31]